MTIRVVIGAGYGDEGKGLVTDYLCQQYDPAYVLRFNGGAQAAHTVHNQYGSFVFGHLGSGTLRNIPTYLSEYFIVNPALFQKEVTKVREVRNIKDHLFYINKNANLSTLIDIWINQTIEKFRGNNRHGSCGVGINETVHRNENPLYGTNVDAIKNHNYFAARLMDIWRHYVPVRLAILGMPQEEIKKAISDIYIEKVISDQLAYNEFLITNTDIIDGPLCACGQDIVFEGAQGLMLDEHHQFFPYVTRSKTNLYNPTMLYNLDEYRKHQMEVYYVTRAYSTRHGAGPFPEEASVYDYVTFEDSTNVYNEFQQSLRLGVLDIGYLSTSIKKDIRDNKPIVPVKTNLVITCLDQITGKIVVTFFGKDKRLLSIPEFVKVVKTYTEIDNIYLNFSKETPKQMYSI